MFRYLYKGFISVFLAILMTAIAAVPVMAADLRGAETITVASGEVINGDMYLAAGDITINGTVNGDIWAAARTITINGTINGSITAGAQTISVNGTIARSARIAGQALIVSGSIKTDLLAFGATLDITEKAKVGSDLIFGSSTARIAGQIDGNISGGSSDITLSNGVGGNIKLGVEKLTITSTASIKGNLEYMSQAAAHIQEGARITGKVTQTIPEPEGKAAKRTATVASTIIWKLLSFIMALVAGIVIIFTIRGKIISMADVIKTNPLSSLGWGALILFVTPIAAIVVCFTVIGLPVGIISLVLYGIAIYLSQIPVALCIGRLIFSRSREIDSGGMMVGTLATGLAILALLRLIPVIGFLVSLGTALFGLGSLVSSRITLRTEPR